MGSGRWKAQQWSQPLPRFGGIERDQVDDVDHFAPRSKHFYGVLDQKVDWLLWKVGPRVWEKSLSAFWSTTWELSGLVDCGNPLARVCHTSSSWKPVQAEKIGLATVVSETSEWLLWWPLLKRPVAKPSAKIKSGRICFGVRKCFARSFKS